MTQIIQSVYKMIGLWERQQAWTGLHAMIASDLIADKQEVPLTRSSENT